MNTIHIHEVLDIIYNSGKSFTIDSLKEEVMNSYGDDVHFVSCADHKFGIEGMVDFMHERGKIVLEEDRIFPVGSTKCDH